MTRLKFKGSAGAFLKIAWADFLLVILTLSLYYPKAMIREMKYLYAETTLAEHSFSYSGTYKSYLMGYLRALLAIILGVGIFGGAFYLMSDIFKDIPQAVFFSYLFLYISYIFLLTPIILFGSLTYHLNNTGWKTAQVKWSGKLSEFLPLHFLGSLLTMLTLGFYSPWQEARLNKFYLTNLQFGSLQFDYSGNGKSLFSIYWKGLLFGILTLGIYSIWNFKARYNYTVCNMVVKKGEHEFKLHSNANTLEVYELILGNVLIVVLTLGFGIPWAYIRYIRFMINHCIIPESFNLDVIEDCAEVDVANDAKANWLDKLNPRLIF